MTAHMREREREAIRHCCVGNQSNTDIVTKFKFSK